MATKDIRPNADGEGNIGTAAYNWLKGWFKSIFVSGNLTDGTNNVSVSAIASHIASTSNPHSVTYTQAGADASGAAATVAGNLSAHAGLGATAHGGMVASSEKGAASGVAPLGSDSKISISYMPDVLRYYLGYFASLSALQTAYPTANAGNYASVAVTGGTDKIYLYDAETGWVVSGGNGNVTSVNGQTGVVVLDAEDVGAAASSHTQAANTISDSTTAGRALLTAADATAQRTALGLGGAATKDVGTTAGTVAAGNDSRFVALSDSNPAMDSTASAGTGTTASRADHVHPVDTSRMPLAQSQQEVSTSSTLTKNKMNIVIGSTALTLTMPTLSAGEWVGLWCLNSGHTLNYDGTRSFYLADGTTATSITIAAGDQAPAIMVAYSTNYVGGLK